MSTDIRRVRDMNGLISYFADTLGWRIDLDDFDDIEDISYDFEAEDIGLKEEAFAKIKSLRQLPPLVDGQKWGIFCVEFDSKKFEVTALRKILSGLIPKRRNSADHAVWSQQDLLFLCFWGNDNDRTIGIAHFEDMASGLPQIKMISCAPAVEDFTQIKVFEDRLKNLRWPMNYVDHEKWRSDWSGAFSTGYKQTIRDATTLTVQLAVEAQGIRDRILAILAVESPNGYVHLLYEKFKNTLIHDMTEIQFADMYAQTVVYGLFSARCMDESQENFSVSEAVECIPSTNPFLKSLMRECLGSENNSKLSFDELEIGDVVDLLMHTKTDSIIADFNRQTGGGREDPVIHFYEEFLTAYDKQQKVQRGVYYTPQPVVNFIVRAVDTILKNDFGYADGLASTETKKIKVKRQSKVKQDGVYKEVEDVREVPAVQVLDPATGTGTFIRQTILQIYDNFKEKNRNLSAAELKKAWNDYVPVHLLPRINAFELMMAPYAVAHMKLAMVLKDTGYEFGSNERLNLYLTNTLEEAGNSEDQFTLWSDPLAAESIAANIVKKDPGINVVIGNPPYSSSSSNRGEWILNLITTYKQDLNEKKINLDDDYIKFIRFGQHVIDIGGFGILAYISNNSFIDGITHRTMRKELMNSFNSIYIINLHGNSKKKETAPDGSRDENVFDIQQGVSINIFVRSRRSSPKCKVYHKDLFGTRELKYYTLQNETLGSIGFTEIDPVEPNFFFVPKNFSGEADYANGIDITDLFRIYNSGVQSKRDKLVVSFTPQRVEEIIQDFRNLTADQLRYKYDLPPDGRDWTVAGAIADIKNNAPKVIPYAYRPFDIRYTAYTGHSRGFMGYPRDSVMSHFLGKNIGLITCRLQTTFPFQHALVTDLVSDLNSISMQTGEQSFVFPLFMLSCNLGSEHRQANLVKENAQKIASAAGYNYSESNTYDSIGPEEIFAYVYAILYTPKYRSRYREFLKIGFPKIPIPRSKESFDSQVLIGKKLINLHLMQDKELFIKGNRQVSFTDKKIDKYRFEDNKIYINKSSFISGVAESTWNMYIGGYQPIQKWLKERKGIVLSDDDVLHLLMIIQILEETSEKMIILDELYG